MGSKVLIGCAVVGVVIIGLVCMLGGTFISFQNNFVRLGNTAQKAWSDVESNYQRRYDLYNTEAASIKGMTAEERTYFNTFVEQSAALSQTLNQYYAGQANDATLQAALAKANKSLVDVKSYVLDAHPEITSTALFQNFQVQAEGTENRILVSRMDYNDAVTTYRNAVQTFPGSLIAGMTGFSADKYPFFQASDQAQTVPTLDFGTSPTAVAATATP